MNYLAIETEIIKRPIPEGVRRTTVGGFDISLPKSIQDITNNAGSFGDNLLQWVIALALTFGILIAVIMILWSGIQWITSEGDKTKLQAAKTRLSYSVIGLIVMFSAFFIINIIGTFFGVKLIE